MIRVINSRRFSLAPFLTSTLLGAGYFSPLPYVLDFVFSIRSELTLTTHGRTALSNQHRMSNKLRRYMKALWIIIILSVFHFAFAAPVAVGKILEVRSNVVDIFKDGAVVWEKRMDIDSDDHWSTNEAHRKDINRESDAPGGGDEGVDDEGVKQEDGIHGIQVR